MKYLSTILIECECIKVLAFFEIAFFGAGFIWVLLKVAKKIFQSKKLFIALIFSSIAMSANSQSKAVKVIDPNPWFQSFYNVNSSRIDTTECNAIYPINDSVYKRGRIIKVQQIHTWRGTYWQELNENIDFVRYYKDDVTWEPISGVFYDDGPKTYLPRIIGW